MARNTTPTPDIPSALANFDSLPDSAHVRAPVVAALRGCSINTVWRQAKAGDIPKPVKLSPGVSAWNVGSLRRHLAGQAQ
jgi:predicted DNA-binding transcriptional regulator AlpA